MLIPSNAIFFIQLIVQPIVHSFYASNHFIGEGFGILLFNLKKIKIRVNKFLSLTVSEIVVTLTVTLTNSDVKSNLVSR